MLFKRSRAIVVLVSLVFVLVSLEISLRVTMRQRYPKGYYHVDQKSGLLSAAPHYEGFYRTEYGLVRIKTNRYGFRGQALNRFKADVQRILILGDSFVQAAQINYEQTFGYVLQSRISDAQVMQVGIPGWGQGDQLRWLKTYYEEFRPHLVIVAVFVGNDLSLDNMKKDNLGSSGRVVTRNGDLLGGRVNDSIRLSGRLSLTRSYVYAFIRNRLKILKRRLTTRASTDSGGKPVPAYFRNVLPIYERDPEKRQPYYATFFELIEEFKTFCAEKTTRLIILGIPWDVAMREDRFAETIRYFGLDVSYYDIRLPNTIIAEYMQRIGMPYIDLMDHWIKKNNPLDAYGRRDPHFSPTGHVWTAEALHELVYQ